MNNRFFYHAFAAVCFFAGFGVSLAPALGHPYNVLQTVCLLLGFIGYGVFEILLKMTERS